MQKIIGIIIVFFPTIIFGQALEIKDTPNEYIEHIVKVWDIDKQRIVYISNQSTLEELSTILHNSILSFVKGNYSTSAEILDGKREIDPQACGLALNNLEIENIKKNLKLGNDYTKIHLKKIVDDSNFEFDDKLTTVLLYSKKLDFFTGDYFRVLKELSKKDIEYVIIVFDNEINEQIPNALKNPS